MIPYLIIVFVSCLITFVLKGLINKFLKEEELYEAYLEEHKEELANKLSKEEEKVHKEAIKKLKIGFKPEFSRALFLCTAFLECVLLYFLGVEYHFFVYSILVIILEISFVTDIKMCIIPDETNYVGAIIGFIYCIVLFFYNDITRKEAIDLLLGGVVAFVVFFLIGALAYLILKKEGMGGGDMKLVLVIGLFMGLKNFVQILALSFFIASIVSIFLLITKKKDKQDYIPFGPYLCIATYITMLIPAMTTMTLWYKWMLGL